MNTLTIPPGSTIVASPRTDALAFLKATAAAASCSVTLDASLEPDDMVLIPPRPTRPAAFDPPVV